MSEFLNVATHLLVTGGLLSLLVLGFLALFLVPGIIHWFRLRNILVSIGSLEAKTTPSEFKKLFIRDKQLSHLWAEYSESLHTQREERDGQMHVLAVRSTIAAETYFNEQFVVDSRLRTEFFKHLPGIFTGLGIIGTFTGLIEGLRHFQVSENAATVRASLESLMHAVGEAFLISAAAITAAMAVTFLEKLLLAALYRNTEAIAHGIDARFESGAGEEYLSRLVNASEASASQSKILKDALVKELGDILRELTASQLSTGQQLNEQLAQRIAESTNLQVEAAREDNQALGEVIAGSIEKSLKGPLDKIARSVEIASGDQSASAVQMLNDVMVSFSQRLNDLFGGQINGINELNKQTAQGMQEAVASLNALVGKLEESGKKSTDDMAAQMAASMKAMEERQSSINTQTQEFVDQIRQLVQSSQAETQQKLQATLESIGQQMTTILSQLSVSQAQVFEDNRAREQSMANRASDVVNQMTGNLSALVGKIEEGSRKTTEEMAAQMAASVKSMEERQANINTETQEFVGQIRQIAQTSQVETQQKLQESIGSIGQQMTNMLTQMNESQATVFEDNRAREQAMSDRALSMVSQMSVSVESAATQMSAASQKMAQSVSTLSAATSSTVDKMSAGATRLDNAATKFAASGDNVALVMDKAAMVSGKLTELSGALTTSSGALQEALRDYKSQRDAVSVLLGDVRATVELAKKEASLTGDVLQRIETSTTKLSQAQKAADEYLDGVSQVLADSSEAFRESVVSTLAKVNHDFHTKLSSAVGLLSTAVQELEVTLGGSLAPRH